MGFNFKDRINKVLKTTIKTCGESIKYRPQKGGQVEICVVFDNEYLVVDPDTEALISSNQPRIGVLLCDLPGGKASKGDVVIAENKKYHVIDSQEDGQGGATLILHVGELY